jgi:hypothetical protein
MKAVVSVNIRGYKEGSIIENIDHKNFYFPNSCFDLTNRWKDESKLMLEKSFEYLGDDRIIDDLLAEEEINEYYLVKEDVIHYRVDNIIYLGEKNHNLDESLIDSEFNIREVFDEIENKIKFDKYGHSNLFITCLYEENWHTDYWGESDGYCRYIGILNSNGSLTKKSIERNKMLKQQEEEYWSQYEICITGW